MVSSIPETPTPNSKYRALAPTPNIESIQSSIPFQRTSPVTTSNQPIISFKLHQITNPHPIPLLPLPPPTPTPRPLRTNRNRQPIRTRPITLRLRLKPLTPSLFLRLPCLNRTQRLLKRAIQMLIIARIQINPKAINAQTLMIHVLEPPQNILARTEFRIRFIADVIREEFFQRCIRHFADEAGEIVEDEDDC